MHDLPIEIARDVAAIGRIGVIPTILEMICTNTGLGFAAVARVTDKDWTACAVHDAIGFGLEPGGQLEVHTTLCIEAREARQPVVFDHASQHPVYRDHHTPRLYSIESYISVPIVLPDGEYFGNLCAIDPRPADVSNERTVTMFTLFADLIALQLQSQRSQLAAESALLDERVTSDLREQFIAVLGHDLRNSLSAIDATAEVLLRRPAQIDPVTMGRRLKSATQRMSRLIDDVMDFARGRLGGGLGVTLAPAHNLTAALNDVVTELRTSHPERNVESRIASLYDLKCDRARIQQLLSNLLANALTHGADSEPVRVDVTHDGNTLTLAVANGGVPITPANLPRVFEPYWRPATSAPGGGLGLGLYICDQIVKAHGGTLSVESSLQAGTCFTARIPMSMH